MIAVSDTQHPIPDISQKTIEVEHDIASSDPSKRQAKDQTREKNNYHDADEQDESI
jgi:hypothetical protein